MSKSRLIALYDQDQRINVEFPGMRREATPDVVRHIDTFGRGERIITYSRLDTERVDERIRAQISFFQGMGQDFEWKVFDYDEPQGFNAPLGSLYPCKWRQSAQG